MRYYGRLFILSLSATVILNVPFLIHHRLPWHEAIGVAAMIPALGLFAAWSYTMRVRWAGPVSKEWQFHFALFPATFALVLQAILVCAVNYIDYGNVIPTSTEHRIMVVAGLAAFGCRCGCLRVGVLKRLGSIPFTYA